MEFKIVGINELRKGDSILVDDQFLCKVTEISLSAPGKHGHAKARIEAAEIFSNSKYKIAVGYADTLVSSVVAGYTIIKRYSCDIARYKNILFVLEVIS